MNEKVFADVTAVADDPILSLTGKFLADPRDYKVNLGVGMYLDETGANPLPHTYIPQTGFPLYDSLVQKLIFGEDSEVVMSGRACTVQTLGGTGALKLGCDLMHWACGLKLGATSIPTWTNHNDILRLAGYAVQGYRYYDAEQNAVN